MKKASGTVTDLKLKISAITIKIKFCGFTATHNPYNKVPLRQHTTLTIRYPTYLANSQVELRLVPLELRRETV